MQTLIRYDQSLLHFVYLCLQDYQELVALLDPMNERTLDIFVKMCSDDEFRYNPYSGTTVEMQLSEYFAAVLGGWILPEQPMGIQDVMRKLGGATIELEDVVDAIRTQRKLKRIH
jgi:hypothetical protein